MSAVIAIVLLMFLIVWSPVSYQSRIEQGRAGVSHVARIWSEDIDRRYRDCMAEGHMEYVCVGMLNGRHS